MQAAILQLNVSDDPVANLAVTREMFRAAVADGAQFVLTPEVTNCVSTSRKHQQEVLQFEEEDITLAALRDEAKAAGVWLLIGSLGLKTGDADRRFANRSFVIGPDGAVVAKYDKIHMFDVQISETETWRESEGYRPGDQAVLAQTDFAKIGMSVCYDVRFSQLYRALAIAGADILTVPAAFSPVTGAAHWHALLRARAIESGCFVIAPAQTGTHASETNKTRDTYGHSLVVDPWGEVILDAGTTSGVYKFDLDMKKGEAARRRVPSLANARDFSGP
ncbi:carbon-nitrogen hydrolase family protein [Sulfitobacter sp. M57]|uniref:carbon-nitrogen hydrolase family protein n=1 Tax=unclassified Sulfitobacter TaxID=196795 RepID=UPI0023E11C9A|nr:MULTISPECIES: carbon-nitrogen hydrolase family protein [unclassified Sulfitobacter]MDF3414950.1 carbon-nitrogen hydrolase family protein [Sulfitobacter sp. KE5]MDF3422431.1 carbon-nitrogen hydrolase family protein [Sulfitobacter sp. KE43]MDF3433496.1 carbon-nitrogen hydrolase family protein [Sulfitobacter sp. KE42]MDF3459136.1 carbon-nitrogen hydrolase family protein [Sulfitobacter sp. S74]MDF3463035.1 carbon-nitrogen hydrolase family protein [Sulfitobacter sp. Ks18]